MKTKALYSSILSISLLSMISLSAISSDVEKTKMIDYNLDYLAKQSAHYLKMKEGVSKALDKNVMCEVLTKNTQKSAFYDMKKKAKNLEEAKIEMTDQQLEVFNKVNPIIIQIDPENPFCG